VMCEEARRLEARMIVVGNRRVQGAARVLGSIASDVAKHAPCDVYIANTTGTATKHAGD
jgi:nucleotide-binding universal stress UspA family protein